MSALDTLKNNVGDIMIDATGSANDDVVDMGAAISAADTRETPTSSKKTVIRASINPKTGKASAVTETAPIEINAAGSGQRATVDISQIAKPEENVNEDIHESLEKDLLDGPDSVFAEFLARKEQEVKEWEAARAEEAEIRALEDDVDEEENIDTELLNNPVFQAAQAASRVEGEDETVSEVSQMNGNDVEFVEEDLSSLLDDEPEEDTEDEEEEEDIMPNTEEMYVNDAAPVDEEIEEDIIPVVDDTDEDLAEEEPAAIEEETSEDDDDLDELADADAEEEEDHEESISSDELDLDVEESDEFIGVTDDVDTDEDLAEDDEELSDEEEDEDAALKRLKKLATEKIRPVSTRLDISSFTVLKKPATKEDFINSAPRVRVAKWVLPAQNATVLMKEFTGAELELLNDAFSRGNQSIDAMRRGYKMIYDHIASPKPAKFDTWLKTTPISDVDHYFFAIYIAAFRGANYLPHDCVDQDKCKNTWLTDDVDIMDMVKFDSKADKKKFMNLYQSEAVGATGSGVYAAERIPLSDSVAVDLKIPTIYDSFEINMISAKARDKYVAVVPFIPYISTVFNLDIANRSLAPIKYHVFKDDEQKTIHAKIAAIYQAFKALRSDEFNILNAYIGAITDKSDKGMHYIFPTSTCPKCKKVTEERRVSAQELVFTRYQLSALTTMSLE